jgi:hypothetical protein
VVAVPVIAMLPGDALSVLAIGPVELGRSGMMLRVESAI